MKPLYVLIGAFALALTVQKVLTGRLDYRLAGRIAMGAMLVFTAVGHFAFTQGMAAMVPNFLPMKREVVIATGALELLFAVGLWIPRYQTFTGWVLVAFFLLILPANVKASLENINYQTGELNGPGVAYLWFRVPLQLFFIAWAYLFTIRT